MEEEKVREGRPLAETPTWAVASVVTFMVVIGFSIHCSLKRIEKVIKQILEVFSVHCSSSIV